jgi:hypothetical protein
MFFSAMALTVYICLALTVMYPLLESIPDFAAMEAYRNLAGRWGGYENFLFNFGTRHVLQAEVTRKGRVLPSKTFLLHCRLPGGVPSNDGGDEGHLQLDRTVHHYRDIRCPLQVR